jgi:hypothetical protein
MTTITDKAAKAISHLDSSRTARRAGYIGSAESALDAARRLLLELAGELDGANVTDIKSMNDAQLSPILESARQEVDRRAREGATGLLTEHELGAVRRLDKLSAIKSIRDRTGLRLIDAREYLERAISTGFPGSIPHKKDQDDMPGRDEYLRRLQARLTEVAAGRELEAIAQGKPVPESVREIRALVAERHFVFP